MPSRLSLRVTAVDHGAARPSSTTPPRATVASRTGAVSTGPFAVKARPEKTSASGVMPTRAASSALSTSSVAPVSTTKRTGVPFTSSVR